MKKEIKIALNKYMMCKKIINELESIKSDTVLRTLFLNFLNKLEKNQKNITFCNFVKNTLENSDRSIICSAVLDVISVEKNLLEIEKLFY